MRFFIHARRRLHRFIEVVRKRLDAATTKARGGNENRNWLELVVIGDGGFMSRCNGAQVMQPHASDCRRARERER